MFTTPNHKKVRMDEMSPESPMRNGIPASMSNQLMNLGMRVRKCKYSLGERHLTIQEPEVHLRNADKHHRRLSAENRRGHASVRLPAGPAATGPATTTELKEASLDHRLLPLWTAVIGITVSIVDTPFRYTKPATYPLQSSGTFLSPDDSPFYWTPQPGRHQHHRPGILCFPARFVAVICTNFSDGGEGPLGHDSRRLLFPTVFHVNRDFYIVVRSDYACCIWYAGNAYGTSHLYVQS
ncbi:hypothetical protein DFJ77DRAFT_153964 [Powellomyces hirtus]|nr:hypothetical protein DFJ77DRAFT_153964 [Powellomyces hirtus]